jgi:hypothetical protein
MANRALNSKFEIAFLMGTRRAIGAYFDWKHLALPIQQPWDPSTQINSPRRAAAGRFLIEMQSGDTLIIEAAPLPRA